MNIQISGRNIKITDGLEDYTRQKIEKLDRYLPNINEIRVDLSMQNTRRGEDLAIAQITVQHKRGAILRSEEKLPGEIHHSIDSAVDKMYRQIQRFKGKRSRKGRERFSATVEELALAENLPLADEVAVEQDATNEEIIRRKEVQLIPMSESDAIEQMELLGHGFFMFYNAETGDINVVYRRSNDGYGLLQPVGI